MSEEQNVVYIDYTNYRGERAVRMIRPLSIRFASTSYHTEIQWLLRAFDLEKMEEREFAMLDVHRWSRDPLPPPYLGPARFECHITCSLEHAEAAARVARDHHWKTSEIARDPVLGNATYFYLTTHGPNFTTVSTRMRFTCEALEAAGANVIREKIEEITYDKRRS